MVYERVFPRPSPRGGFERLPADRALYTQKERGSAAFSSLNHRFTATFLWAAPNVGTTSSGRSDPPYTPGLGCPTLKARWVGHAGGRWVGRWVGPQVGQPVGG